MKVPGFHKILPVGIIFFLIQVLTSIHFDDQFTARRAKIGNIQPDGVLPAKVNSVLP